MEISTSMVKELRAATGAGVMDCRKALEAASGNFDQAVALLNEKALTTAAKKASREANEGLVGNYVEPGGKLAALVEVNCESDFVARTPDFQTLVQDLARQVAEEGESLASAEDLLAQPYAGDANRSVRDVVTERVAKLGENIIVRRFARLAAAAPGGLIGNYVHMGSKVASLVELDFGSPAAAGTPEAQALAKSLAMQVVAARPIWLRPEDVPADVLQKEAAGHESRFYEEACLLEQPYIRDASKHVKDVVADAAGKLGTDVAVRAFARLEVGD